MIYFQLALIHTKAFLQPTKTSHFEAFNSTGRAKVPLFTFCMYFRYPQRHGEIENETAHEHIIYIF